MNPNIYAEPPVYLPDSPVERVEVIDGTLRPRDGLWNSAGLLWTVAVLAVVGLVAYVFFYERDATVDKIDVYRYQPASSAAGTAAPVTSGVASSGKDAIPTVAVPAVVDGTGGTSGGSYPSAANPHAIGAAPPNSPVPGAANTVGKGEVPVKK